MSETQKRTAGAQIVVLRMRGEVGTRKEILDTFRMLGMKKLYSVALLENNPSSMGMIRKVENFAAWGEATEETKKLLENKKGLKPPKGGFKSKKLHYPKGDLGYRGEKINDLIKRMM